MTHYWRERLETYGDGREHIRKLDAMKARLGVLEDTEEPDYRELLKIVRFCLEKIEEHEPN